MNRKDDKKITRRDFMKKVGYTAAAVGISSSVPGLLKPARAAARDYILIGRPQPSTGPMAAFSEPSPWLDNRALDEINKAGGIYIKEYGKKVPLKIKVMDTQSDPTKAAEVASRLIFKDKVDLMYASHAPATVNPVAQTCERAKMPCLGNNLPNEMFLAGGPYHWSFGVGPLVADFVGAYMDMWTQVKTNKVVGLLAANEVDGVAFAKGSRDFLPKAGYEVIDVGRFPEGTMDFTSLIDTWKKSNVEILFGNLSPPDFIRAWRQCFRMGFLPRICAVGRALLFPSAVEATGGDLGLGLSTETPWHPAFPFKSSLTGYTAHELAEAYEAEKGKQWTEPLGFIYSGYEVLADVLKRAQTLEREAVRKAIADTDLPTILGHVKFNKDNIATTPAGGQQWVKGKKFPYDAKLISAGNWKDTLRPVGKLRTLQEMRGG